VENFKGNIAESQTPSILHLATHGIYEEREFRPENLPGSLAFSRKFLSSNEILELNLIGVQLVVMSACDSRRGKIKADGIFGLSRSFLIAGASMVVASLWKVNDLSTKKLMVKFYEILLAMARMENKISIARAFREAMIWLHLL
jgi:CHAT domain-containing protein